MASRMVGAVGSFGSASQTKTLLVAGPHPDAVETLCDKLDQCFDVFSASAVSDLSVTLDAVGIERIDVAVVDCNGDVDADTIEPFEEAEETAVAALAPPGDRPSAPQDAAVVERRGDWLERLEAWLGTQITESDTAAEAVDAREQYERLLERQNDRLKEFTGIIAHDLRNPLQVIAGQAELARETGGEAHLDSIVETAERMETLLDDLLALSRQGAIVGDPEPIALESVVREAWAQIDTSGAELVFEGPERIVAEPERLRELFENLFSNAVTHAGPDVTITVGPLLTGFFVADDGPGIPPEERANVFDHGYTTSDDGTGFGLSIVESIATAHGWEIELADTNGSARPDGACFEITGVELPTAEEA